MPDTQTRKAAEILGESFLFAGGNVALASALQSSIFSIESFAKDIDTMNSAKQALNNYMLVGGVWTLGTAGILYAEHGFWGGVAGFGANAAIMSWIWASYQNAFSNAAKRWNVVPKSASTSSAETQKAVSVIYA